MDVRQFVLFLRRLPLSGVWERSAYYAPHRIAPARRTGSTGMTTAPKASAVQARSGAGSRRAER